MAFGRPPGGSFVAVGPNLAAKAARKPCLGGPGGALGTLVALLEPSWGSGRGLWRNVKYSKNIVFYSVFGLPGPPGGVRNRSKIDPGSLLDVSWDQRSVWRAQVEVHEAQVGSESGSWAGRRPPGPARLMSAQVEKSLTRPDMD